MSSRRSIAWLLFLVALAVAAHALVSSRPGRAVLPVRAATLVPEADRATLVELVRPGAPAVVAVRSDRWRLTAPFAAPADEAVVLRLLDLLAFAPVTDGFTALEMRRLGRTPADFELTEPVLTVTVRREMADATVRFGRRTPAGDGVYASVSTRPGVSIVASNVFACLDRKIDDLRDRRLLAEATDAPSAVDVRRATGRFVRVARSAAGDWQMLEPMRATVSAARVASLVAAVEDARASRFVWPVPGEAAAETPAVSLLAGYGLDAASALTVTLTGPDGSSRYVSFGKEDDGRSVYALVQNGSAVVTVPAALRDRLLAEAESFADLKLFPYEESALSSISIVDGDATYLLARTQEGEWRLDSPVAAPADRETVHALLQTILSLRPTERDSEGLLVSVSTNAPAVPVARDALLVQNRLEDLRSKTVLKMPSDRIRRLSVTTADGRRQAAVWDAAKRTWLVGTSDGATLNGLALAGVLGALDPLSATAVVRIRIAAAEAGNYGLEKPRFTIAVDPSDEGAVRRNILIGSPAPGGGAYATVGSTDAVFTLSDETVRALTAPFAAKE